MSPKQTDVGTRVDELAATVRGLTQELVEANERIRQLEAALDEGDDRRGTEVGARDRSEENGTEESTKQMEGPDQADGETPSDLDDIIVA